MYEQGLAWLIIAYLKAIKERVNVRERIEPSHKEDHPGAFTLMNARKEAIQSIRERWCPFPVVERGACGAQRLREMRTGGAIPPVFDAF